MIIKSAELETVTGISTGSFPVHSLPELAFAGRSNVGKSSLINCLLNRKNLARTSSTPGKTQTINYYNINKAIYFVDLPGYGYAKVRMDFKKAWAPMIERYLKGSPSLKNLFLLVDMRRAPTEDDMNMYRWAKKAGFDPVIVATKADKLKRSEFKGTLRTVTEAYSPDSPRIVAFSSETRLGREELLEIIEQYTEG